MYENMPSVAFWCLRFAFCVAYVWIDVEVHVSDDETGQWCRSCTESVTFYDFLSCLFFQSNDDDNMEDDYDDDDDEDDDGANEEEVQSECKALMSTNDYIMEPGVFETLKR